MMKQKRYNKNIKRVLTEEPHGINYDEYNNIEEYREYVKKLIKENKIKLLKKEVEVIIPY